MIELVWDARQQGTGRGTSGASLRVGADTHFSPEDLLGLAAAGCLMKTFLTLAEEAALPFLSYLSTAELVPGEQPDRPLRMCVRTYVTAANEADRRRLERVVARARRDSPIASLLGDRVEIISECSVLAGASPE
jgi:organic hydroperoxide reductase OsmC/OhrA